MTKGWEVWRGMSQLDLTTPIVVIATRGSSNAKTGDMIQTWILRQDAVPSSHASHGAGDQPICGNCPLRGSEASPRRCYVNTAFAPNGVWKAWQRGAYGVEMPSDARGQALRLGAYGDPAAVPLAIWLQLMLKVAPKKWTGYTHQWRECDPLFASLCMASVETEGEMIQARSRGYRTFRTGHQVIKGVEILCPASKEGGFKTTCEKCGLCSGAGLGSKSIMIHPHGSAKGRFLNGE